MRNIVTIAAVLVGLSACSMQNSAIEPTHRWHATGSADESQYRADHARCQKKSNSAHVEALDANSVAFEQYKQCMNQQGYELAAYE